MNMATGMVSRWVLLFLTVLVMVGGCTPENNPTSEQEPGDDRGLDALCRKAGLVLPPDANMLFERSGREGGYSRHVIRVQGPVSLPAATTLTLSAETTVASLNALMPDLRLGPLLDERARVGEWSNDHGAWRAVLIQVETGRYLDLEWFAK